MMTTEVWDPKLYAEQCVEKGAVWLDEHIPGWEHLIDASSLRMAHTCKCVLGQIAGHELSLDEPWKGDYQSVLSHFDLDDNVWSSHDFGFNGVENRAEARQASFISGHPVATYRDLKAAWVREIEVRRAS